LRRRGNEADGAEPPSDAFEFPDATCGFIVLPDGDGDLHGRREQGDSPQLIMAPLFKSPPDGNRSSCCIAAGEMEKCEARLALGSTGASVAEGAFGKVQFASDEVDHAQFVVRVPGVKEIDRLYRCAIGQRSSRAWSWWPKARSTSARWTRQSPGIPPTPDDSMTSTHSAARSKSATASSAWADQQKI
jgi:hypothetical protein